MFEQRSKEREGAPSRSARRPRWSLGGGGLRGGLGLGRGLRVLRLVGDRLADLLGGDLRVGVVLLDGGGRRLGRGGGLATEELLLPLGEGLGGSLVVATVVAGLQTLGAASATMRVRRPTERIASSLPGIG